MQLVGYIVAQGALRQSGDTGLPESAAAAGLHDTVAFGRTAQETCR